MAESDFMNRIVGVFPTETAARQAVDAAVAAGADRSTIGFGQDRDQRGALMDQMQEEMDGATVGPLTAAIPAPARKALYATVVVAGVIGAVIGLLVALLPLGSWALGLRLLVYGLVGAACGVTIGFVVGGSLGARGPAAPATSEGGFTVGVSAPSGVTGPAAEAMGAQGALRVDVFDTVGAGHRLHRAPEPSTAEALRRVGHRLGQSEGDWRSDES